MIVGSYARMLVVALRVALVERARCRHNSCRTASAVIGISKIEWNPKISKMEAETLNVLQVDQSVWKSKQTV